MLTICIKPVDVHVATMYANCVYRLRYLYVQDLAYLNGGTGAGGRGGGGGSESVCTTHSHELTALALSVRGAMVATASTKVEVQAITGLYTCT